jgi:hypothetical protein
MPSPFTTAARAAVLAIALGGATLTAMPAQAQPTVEFNFSIGGERFHQRYCLTNPQVRKLLRWQGYREIRFTDRRGRYVTVRAERRNRDYRITVDTCRGRIVDVDRIRRR